MGKQLFPDAPADLTALGDEQLADLLASFKAVSRQLKAGEIDLADHFGEELSAEEQSAEAMRQWREAAELCVEIRGALKANEEARATFAEEAAAIDAAFGDDEPETAEVVAEATADEPEALAADDPDAEVEVEAAPATELSAEVEVAEAEAEQEAVLVASPAAPAAPKRVLYPAVPKSHRSREASHDGRTVLVAAAGQQDVRAGTELDATAFAESMIAMARRRGAVKKYKGGGEERILLASADLAFPEERWLREGDTEGNLRKIKAIGSPYFDQESREALLAAGGICNPPTPFYDLPNLVTTARPIRDGLPGFRAERGAVSVPSVSTIGSIDSAISVITAADDGEGGTFATKSCQAFDCAQWTEVAVTAIAHCREYGNLTSRSWPEGIAHENKNTMGAWARTAEGLLLDRIDALSIDLTRSAVYGAASTLLYALTVSRVQIISQLRLDRNTRFTVILPFWAAEMFSLDLVNSMEEHRFEYPADAISALFSRFGFNVIWHLDEGISDTADTEIWPAEVDGTEQNDWPGSTVIARLFPAAQFLYLDGGSLELGLVRDSDLNSTNDYQMFGESWENLARIGPAEASHRLAITVCPNGTAAPTTGSVFTCSGT